MIPESKLLVEKVGRCVHICNDCFNSCLEEEMHMLMMMKDCIKICKECAQICALTLELVYKGAHFKRDVLKLCIEACGRCAAECRKHDMDHMRECAEACADCEEACKMYLKEVLGA